MPPTISQTRYAEPVVDKVRKLCLRRGAGGLKELARSFRREVGGVIVVKLDVFEKLLTDSGIILKPSELDMLYTAYGEEVGGEKTVDVERLVAALNGLSGVRREVVDEAFRRLDVEGRGYLVAGELLEVYNAAGHPKVISGEMDEEQAREVFVRGFDADGDEAVTYEEFLSYYAGVGHTVDNDEFFNHLVYNSWNLDNLPPRRGPSPASPTRVAGTASQSRSRLYPHATTRPANPPPPKRIVGYTGHVPGAQDTFGECFSTVEQKSKVPEKTMKLPPAPYKDEEHAFVRKGNASNMHSFRLE